ncbi:MAG: hypothetical protein Q9205_006817, partial [Flavoplaca limonia]
QRKRAIEESQQLKMQKHDQWERQRLQRYVAALDAEQSKSLAQGSQHTSGKTHEINIDGLRFQVLNGGSKLVRIVDTSRATPKRANVQGVTFVRSKHGNLYRSGVVRASKRAPVPRAIRVISLMKRHRSEYLLAYISCEGSAPIRAAGTCRKNKCDLPHVDRAGQIRKHAAQSVDAGVAADNLKSSNANDSDLSSEEDDYADTDGDDVDSDDLEDEILVGVNDPGPQELAQQNDFVQLLGQ